MLQVFLKFLQIFFGHPMFDFSLFSNTLQLFLFCLSLFIASVPFSPLPFFYCFNVFALLYLPVLLFLFFLNHFSFCRFVFSVGENVKFPMLLYIVSLKVLVFKSQLKVEIKVRVTIDISFLQCSNTGQLVTSGVNTTANILFKCKWTKLISRANKDSCL